LIPASITIVVEGDTDAPFATRLCEAAGFQVSPLLVASGWKSRLDSLIPNLLNANRSSPYLILRDLDCDEECPGTWLSKNRLTNQGDYYVLRLAVHAVEAWFLADHECAAAALHVGAMKLPMEPEKERDPKVTLVNLARMSTKPRIQTAIVPKPGLCRKTAPGYGSWFIEAARSWSVERAIRRSPSLARARQCIEELRTCWHQRTL